MAAKAAGERVKAIAFYEKAIRAKPVDLGIYRAIACVNDVNLAGACFFGIPASSDLCGRGTSS